MKDKIYLIVNASGVQAMRKNLVATRRGEVCVALTIEMPDDAMKPPVLEKFVAIDSWHAGIDIDDVKFDKNIITEEEAEIIKVRRLEKMKEILESQGFEVNQKDQE